MPKTYHSDLYYNYKDILEESTKIFISDEDDEDDIFYDAQDELYTKINNFSKGTIDTDILHNVVVDYIKTTKSEREESLDEVKDTMETLILTCSRYSTVKEQKDHELVNIYFNSRLENSKFCIKCKHNISTDVWCWYCNDKLK